MKSSSWSKVAAASFLITVRADAQRAEAAKSQPKPAKTAPKKL